MPYEGLRCPECGNADPREMMVNASVWLNVHSYVDEGYEPDIASDATVECRRDDCEYQAPWPRFEAEGGRAVAELVAAAGRRGLTPRTLLDTFAIQRELLRPDGTLEDAVALVLRDGDTDPNDVLAALLDGVDEDAAAT